MKTLILAAGNGIRMRPLTLNCPKPMISILGKPLLHRIIDELPNEAGEIVLVVGYLGEQIKNYFGDEFKGRKINYVEQDKKMGTAHALWLAREKLKEERFLMLYADDLQSKDDINACLKYPLSLLVKEVPDPRKFGVIVTDENKNIKEFVEKPEVPPSNLASTGVLVLDSRIFKYPAREHKNGEFYVTDSVAQLAQDNDIRAVEAKFWLPIGYPEDIKKAEEHILQKEEAGMPLMI